MKITVCVRTRNEENNISRFIRSYSWADEILVADGGSEDQTISIAQRFPKVFVREFGDRVWGDNGIWRNPEGRHINFLLNWAKEVRSDWVIFDDCDSFPTKALQNNAREEFSMADRRGYSGILAYHIYLYGSDKWFPDMNIPGKFIWAWRSDCGLTARSTEDWGIILDKVPSASSCVHLEYPNSLLHDFCPTEEIVQKKLNFYQKNGRMSMTPHPLQVGGSLANREAWMVD